MALCQRDHNWQLQKRNVAFAVLRPVYPGGSNVFAQAGLHMFPLARGQRRAQQEGHSKVAVKCSLRPGKIERVDRRNPSQIPICFIPRLKVVLSCVDDRRGTSSRSPNMARAWHLAPLWGVSCEQDCYRTPHRKNRPLFLPLGGR